MKKQIKITSTISCIIMLSLAFSIGLNAYANATSSTEAPPLLTNSFASEKVEATNDLLSASTVVTATTSTVHSNADCGQGAHNWGPVEPWKPAPELFPLIWMVYCQNDGCNAETRRYHLPQEAVLESIQVTTLPTKVSYFVNEPLNIDGLVVTGTYSDGTTKSENIALTNISGFNSAAANPALTVTVTVGGKTATFTTEIKEVVLESISVTAQPTKMSYTEGETLNLSGLTVTLIYNNGSTIPVAFANFAANGLTTSPANGTTLTTAHNGTPVTVIHTAGGKTSTTRNLTIAANGTPITSLRIDALSITTMARYEARRFSVILNDGASDENVVWTISDLSLGYVDPVGNVTIFDRTGNVRLTATDPVSGISHSITMRITA